MVRVAAGYAAACKRSIIEMPERHDAARRRSMRHRQNLRAYTKINPMNEMGKTLDTFPQIPSPSGRGSG